MKQILMVMALLLGLTTVSFAAMEYEQSMGANNEPETTIETGKEAENGINEMNNEPVDHSETPQEAEEERDAEYNDIMKGVDPGKNIEPQDENNITA